jgi:transcriptional regulator with XRE-family HTH domain
MASANLLFDTLAAKLNLSSDRQLAKFLGISQGTISKMRSGDQPITDRMFVILHDKCGIDLDDSRALAGYDVSYPDRQRIDIRGVVHRTR